MSTTLIIILIFAAGMATGVMSLGLVLKAALPHIIDKSVDVMIAQGYLSISGDGKTLILQDKRGSKIMLKAELK